MMAQPIHPTLTSTARTVSHLLQTILLLTLLHPAAETVILSRAAAGATVCVNLMVTAAMMPVSTVATTVTTDPGGDDEFTYPLIASYVNTTNLIVENWYPQATYSPSETSASVHQGTIKFRVHPDSEYVMSDHMTTTNVAVASVTIAPSGDVGPIATHSKVTVTTDSAHGLTDEQNQIVMSGSDNPTHINGIHNVHSVSNTTVFTYEIIKSTVVAGEACEGTFKLQTYDGIDKTGAVLTTTADDSGTGVDIDVSERDKLFREAAEVIVTAQQGSASLLQRKLKLGYNRAGRIIDQLEAAGIVGPFEGSKARQVLVTDLAALDQLLNEE